MRKIAEIVRGILFITIVIGIVSLSLWYGYTLNNVMHSQCDTACGHYKVVSCSKQEEFLSPYKYNLIVACDDENHKWINIRNDR